MTARPNQRVSGLLLDVEGTTTPIDFVYKVLFPYSLSHAKQFLNSYASTADVRADLEALRQQHIIDTREQLGPPPVRGDTREAEIQTAVAYMEWLTARDRKSPPFKSLQGRIWQEGYRSGQLRAEVFEDVARALGRWHEQGRKIFIFSSGSVLAQKLLFTHTVAGNLAEHISGYFDAAVGNKIDPTSYRKIAGAVEKNSSEILFVSDVTAELDAAKVAGQKTLLCVRPGNRPQPPSAHRVIHSFDEVLP